MRQSTTIPLDYGGMDGGFIGGGYTTMPSYNMTTLPLQTTMPSTFMPSYQDAIWPMDQSIATANPAKQKQYGVSRRGSSMCSCNDYSKPSRLENIEALACCGCAFKPYCVLVCP